MSRKQFLGYMAILLLTFPTAVTMAATTTKATTTTTTTTTTKTPAPTPPPVPVATAVKSDKQLSVPVLSLEACLKTGYENSRDLQQAAKNVNVAEENVRQAQAGFLPSVSYSAGYNLTGPEADTKNKHYNSANYWDGSLSASLSLYNGGKLSNNLKVATQNLESSKEDARQTKQQLSYDIKTAYYDLWLAEQKLQVAQSSYENLGQHYQQVAKYVQVGSKSKYDLLKAEVNWKSKQTDILSAQNGIALAKLNLATLIGIDKDRDFEIAADPSFLKVPDQTALTLQPLLEEAYRQRPDVRQSGLNLTIAKLNVAITEAAKKPTIDLSAGYSGGGANVSPFDWSKTYQLTVGLNGVLFNGDKTNSQIRAAKEKIEVANLQDGKTRDRVRKNVQSALQQLKENQAEIQINLSNVELAKESLRMTQLRFSAGLTTTLDVKDGQLSLDEAQNNYYQGVASYLTNLAKLDLELGRD